MDKKQQAEYRKQLAFHLKNMRSDNIKMSDFVKKSKLVPSQAWLVESGHADYTVTTLIRYLKGLDIDLSEKLVNKAIKLKP